MAYRALLFCPDEKAARTVTQVLGELEFTVEPCLEPFAAVKKLMGEHFDAVVVDCDNEQNATLLFKSARNSTSNQASLAVAVVEGQAGVAKAFRIGANLVLTKPINIEQSKGTLRVARGLLRKGDPVKPATPVATTPTPTAAAPKPAPVKPVAPARPAAVAPPRPAAPAAAKPTPKPAPAPAASTVPAARPTEVAPEVSFADPIAPPKPAPAPKLPVPAAAEVKPALKPAGSFAAPAASFSSGAASAPAPAREGHEIHIEPAAPASAPDPADALFEKPAEAVASAHSSSEAPTTTFTFGGAAVPAESGGKSKKLLIVVAAAVAVAAGLYFGWTYYQGRTTQTGTFESRIAASSAAAQPVKPASTQPVPAATSSTPAATAPATSSAPSTQPAAQPAVNPAPPSAGASTANNQPAPESDDASDSEPSAKASNSASTPNKSAASSKPAAPAPRVVKGGSVPSIQAKPVVPDTPAPSVIGIAATGSSAPPPNLVGGLSNAPKPVLQRLNISQGVSQGLLMKKVAPSYPTNALAMHVEGAVDLTATISKEGNITAVKVLSGQQLLTKAAVDAVKQWKYKPYLLNGEPVEIQTQITVNFKLPH